jgi:hypothetical protein
MTTQIKIGARTYDSADYAVPAERVFRSAWIADETQGVISVDMTKARDIWRDKIRTARAAEFLTLDAAFIRALETGADTAAIVATKQALRDAPSDPRIDAAQTPDQLKLIQPAGLHIE